MRRVSLWTIIITLCSLLSCAPRPQKVVSSRSAVVVPELFAADSLRIPYLYTEAVRLAAQTDNPLVALPYLEEILLLDSLHAPTNHFMSMIKTELRNPKEAVRHSVIAYAADTTNIDYLSQLAFAEVECGHYAAGKRHFNRLLKLDSKNAYNYHAAAALYAGTGMPHTAIALLDSAEYKLGYIKALADQKRELLMSVKLYDRAKAETLSAVANNPFDIDGYRVLGDIYAATGEDSLAVVNYQKALELAPTNPATLISASQFHYARGNEAEFLALVQQIFANDQITLEHKLKIYDNMTEDVDLYRRNYFSINTLTSLLRIKYPNDYRTADRQATHFIRTGELEKALKVYKSAAETEDAPVEAFGWVISIERHLGHADSVMHYIDRAIDRFPEQSDLHLMKAYELQNRADSGQREVVGEYQKAADLALTAAEKSNAYGSLGDYYYSLGHPNKAFRTYEKALDENPNNATVLNNWAYFLSELVEASLEKEKELSRAAEIDLERALEMSIRAVELEPSNPTYLDSKAWILHLLGRSAEAKPILKQAISLDSSADDTLLLHYADVLAALEENFMAEIYYQRALDAGGDKELIDSRIAKLKEK